MPSRTFPDAYLAEIDHGTGSVMMNEFIGVGFGVEYHLQWTTPHRDAPGDESLCLDR